MESSTLQSYRLPTGELVLKNYRGDACDQGFLGELADVLFRHEIVGFAFSLVSALSSLWFLAS